MANASSPCPRARDGNGLRIAAHDAQQLGSIGGVDFVQHEQGVFGLNAQFLQHVIHGRNLVEGGRIAGVGHVQQEIGLPRFFERGLEAGDQMMRQIADESHRVAEQHRPPAGQLPARVRVRAWRTVCLRPARRRR